MQNKIRSTRKLEALKQESMEDGVTLDQWEDSLFVATEFKSRTPEPWPEADLQALLERNFLAFEIVSAAGSELSGGTRLLREM